MGEENGQRADFLKFISSLVAVTLPVLQFFFGLLPANTTILFLDRTVFGLVSGVAFALTFIAFVAYKANPLFEIAFNRAKQREYNDYEQVKAADPDKAETIPRVEPPYSISYRNIRSYLMAFLIVGVLVFLTLGLTYRGGVPVPVWAVMVQAAAYIGVIVASSLVLIMYYLDDQAARVLERRRASRIRSAIDLAMRHNAFVEVPPVQYLQSVEVAERGEFYTLVRIGERNYLIVTDFNAQVLYRVDEDPELR